MRQETNIVGPVGYTNTIETSLTLVSLRKDGIIEIRFRIDNYEVNVADQQEIHDAVLKLTDNGRSNYHVLVVPGLYGSITKEAREMEMFETKAYQNQKSLAIVVHGLPQRLFGKLYLSLKKNKPKYPCNLFDSEALAVNWILNIKERQVNSQ